MTSASPPAQAAPVNDSREIFGWTMYDWANSAFSTTVVAALFGPYLTALAQSAVGENGAVISLGPLVVTAKSLFPYATSLSVFLQVFLLPTLGAIADYSHLKKRLMAVFCYIGAAATTLFFLITGDLYLLGALLFVLANLSFGASIVLYNAFLPDICTEDQTDKVSSRGFALGYLGGGLLLAANLGLVIGAPSLGLSTGMAVRISLASAGLWWALFSILTFTRLRSRAPARRLPAGQSFLTIGFSQLGATFRELFRLPFTVRYLAGYLFYNDGIQTVIGLASVFLAQELFVAKGLSNDDAQSFLLGVVLMVQFVAFLGALLFERVAARAGTKNAILISLVIWSGVVIYAYGFLATTTQAWIMSAVIALVLGGSQALSRSLFSRMIPPGREASFFGIYEISERGTSWIGPLIFGAVVGATNSYRQAILSLIALFLIGIVLLYFTDTDRAIHDAGHVLPEEAGSAHS
ncbi:MAG TPA: MFS transporter [Kouleothrix sp.]|uniref:MFS transporter n=1 Tax=Kouleothrix sp. TaxID=2779161 RepID=UPI002B78E5B0|nr:MFS transporter [Kouleothrix sp.]HRC77265.1 MFS transporter [Kouleothrix sp.]